MENNNGFNQDLLNLIEGSRFKGSRPLKRKEPTADTTSEQNKSPSESPSILPNNNTSQEAPAIPVQPTIPSMITNRKNFEMTYGMIKEMRRDRTAPVDTMGSYQNPDLSATKEVQDYQLLVSLLLSVQTMDEPTTRAMNKLIEHGLTLENIEVTDEEELKKLISCVNFKNNKAKYIKKCTNIILNKYKGVIPNRREELLKLPGVGKEIAIVYLNHAHDKKSGIGVDSHIHRISNRLGWVDTKTPENTRTELESFIPKEYWYDMNELLIGFGQQICTPIAPKCEGCLLRTICPTGIRNTEVVPKVSKNLKKVKKNNEEQKTDEELAMIRDEGSTSNSNLVGDLLGSQNAGLNEVNDEIDREKSLNQDEPKEDDLS